MEAWREDLKSFGGKMVSGETMLDGKQYDYRSIWDEDEQVDAWLDTFPEGVIKSDRSIIDGYLTVFFLVNPK